MSFEQFKSNITNIIAYFVDKSGFIDKDLESLKRFTFFWTFYSQGKRDGTDYNRERYDSKARREQIVIKMIEFLKTTSNVSIVILLHLRTSKFV